MEDASHVLHTTGSVSSALHLSSAPNVEKATKKEDFGRKNSVARNGSEKKQDEMKEIWQKFDKR